MEKDLTSLEHIDGIPVELTRSIPIKRKFSLDDVPAPDPCVCGHPTQKEFLEHHIWVGGLKVVFGRPMPGYGCTNADCGVKILDESVSVAFYKAAADYFGGVGDEARVALLDNEIRELEHGQQAAG